MISEMSYDTLSSTIEASWESYFLRDNHFEYLIGIFMHERASPNHHFIYENAQAVPINCFSMAFVKDYLRCEILRGTTKGIGSFTRLKLLNKSEIREL